MLLASVLVAIGTSTRVHQEKKKFDVFGTIMMIAATSTLITGFSWLGEPTKRGLSIIMLAISVIAWVGFFLIEKKAEAPILDPLLLANRTFMTASAAGSLGFFGSLGISVYSPIFIQQVMNVRPAISGSMLTPYTIIVALMGILAGFLLAKTKKYKWIYIIGYSITALALLGMWRFTAETPIWLFVLATSFAGFGFGALPTVTTLVAQFAVPKRLLGAAVGSVFFFQMPGIAIAPSVLGIVQNSMPDLEIGLQRVYLVGAVAVLISLFLILTIPQIPIDRDLEET